MKRKLQELYHSRLLKIIIYTTILALLSPPIRVRASTGAIGDPLLSVGGLEQYSPVEPLKLADFTPLTGKPHQFMSQVTYTPPRPQPVIHSNTYDWGNCTWYVKNRRPDIPNRLGNANMWYINGTAQGLSGGTTPRPGAVGVSTRGYYGHVVYVESIQGDLMTVSEMNVRGLGVESSRTMPWQGWQFLY